MQGTVEPENEEMDLRRTRALVESVENWKKSSRSSSSGAVRTQLKSVERASPIMSVGSDGVWRGPFEQSPEEVGTAGSVKMEPGRRVTRAGSRSLQVCQGAAVVEQKPVCEGLVGGSSLASQEDKSTELQLGLGPSSSMGTVKVEDQEHKHPSGKAICEALDDGEDFVMVPDSQRSDVRNGSAEAAVSLRRKTRLGKEIEIDGSDDDSSHPETLLCLGTHPYTGSAPGNSGRGSSSRSPPLGDLETGNFHGNEGTSSRGKRKRVMDRSESAAAVGIALENAGRDVGNLSQSGAVLFSERVTGRRFINGLNTPSLRERRRNAEPEREFISFFEGPSRSRPLTRRDLLSARSGGRPDFQPIFLDPEELNMRTEVDLTEESHQPLTLSLQSPPPTTNPAEQSSAGLNPQIIDLLTPEADHLNANRVIDLVSPERSPVRSGVTGSSVAREESLARRARHRGERMRMRLQSSVNDRLRASTARQRRAADGAGSSQDPLDIDELSANEHNDTELSRRRAEASLLGGHYLMRGAYGSPVDLDDVRVLEELPLYNQMPGGSYRRRQRSFFPRGHISTGGGHPAIRGSYQGINGDFLAGISDEEPFCYTDNVLALGDSDDDDERTRQVAEDERMARQLQARYASEASGGEVPDDETLARMLQAEEDSRARDVRHTRAGEPFGLSAVQRYLGEMESLRRESPPRFLRHVRPRSDMTPAYSSSSSRFNFGPGTRNGRLLPLHRGQHDIDAELHGGRVQFPSHMTMESRLEVLAALESVIQDNMPVGLQLAQVDRDFNENDYEMLLALDADLDRNRGASLEKINLLPVTTLQPTDICEDTCSICLEMQVTGEVVRRLPCIHVFHMKCIDKWLQRQAVCPVCKAHI
ncbi:hypothetical protein R1flu_016400 [Riccia fluitans]|uniref:RING-type domain-containing protein n=1 Tax=Riccia fluitans TaxID=41844 RepID=A0ABD1YLR6_9MARC